MNTISNEQVNRQGQPWKDDEIFRLLKSIQEKKSLETIAGEHGRTKGGIKSRLRVLAADYHYNDGRPIEQIMKFTGLSKAEVEEAINRRVPRKAEPNTKKPAASDQPTLGDVVAILRDIQKTLASLSEKVVYVHT